jgi:hypothetical protein
MEAAAMAVRIEKKGRVWTVIHSRPEARNAMDPESANALVGEPHAIKNTGTGRLVVMVVMAPPPAKK